MSTDLGRLVFLSWWGMDGIEPLALRDNVYSVAAGPPTLIGIPHGGELAICDQT